jgi:Fe-S-cluster-containing dehydrogenase component
MDKARRGFLKLTGTSLLGLGLGGTAIASAPHRPVHDPDAGPRFAMVIDTRKCRKKDGCSACMDACHDVHNVPDIPDENHEVKWIWKEDYPNAFPNQVHPYTEQSVMDSEVLVMCNHCDRPPCVRVCPTQATFKGDDGIVTMDMHRCIGCRYCVAACPYGSRSFNWKDPRPYIEKINAAYPTRTKGVVEKCNFCKELLAKGKRPACVDACAADGNEGVLIFGDLNDPESNVSEALRTANTIRRKPALGTAPHIFYIV